MYHLTKFVFFHSVVIKPREFSWVVYKMGALLGSVGYRVKTHKITTATGQERGDIEIKDYVVLQKT